MANILVLSQDSSVIQVVRSCFLRAGKVDCVKDKSVALEMLRQNRYDFILADLILLNPSSANNYKNAMQPFWLAFPTVEIIVMSPLEMIREAVLAVKAGASNYLTYPIVADEVKYVTESITESNLAQSELDYLRDQFWLNDSQQLVRTNSPHMRQVFEKIRSVAPTISTVLLTGETGTGKGVLAKVIHRHSARCEAQFISVHCGAIPDTLLESELFGHEKGAFTGASRRRLGKFEIAKDGTIFLDEIATITPSAQIKLLQVLQDKIFQRVGGEEALEAEARIIAATNVNLKELCTDGQFRTDLYYRLNVFPIEIPPLRQRKEDIPLLVEVFIDKLNKFSPKDIHGIDPLVLEAFKHYSWPGNIRELENLIERAYILESSPILTPKSFPNELFTFKQQHSTRLAPDTALSLAEMRRDCIEKIEKAYLRELLIQNKGRIQKTADAASITSRQLHKLMKKYDLRKEEFKVT